MAFKDIRRSRKWLSPEEIRIIVLLMIILSALLALNIYSARILPGGEWFFLRWSGARAFLVEQIEPYSTTVAQRVQQIVYDRNAFPTEYAYVLNDPFYIVLLYTPLALFPNFPVVRGIWMLIAETALFISVLFAFRLSEWDPPRWLYVILIGFGLFNFFSLNALVTASPTLLLIFLYLCILLALRSFSDELAGALLFLVAYQWEVSALFFLFIIVFVIANRRWSVLLGFGMSLVVLLIVSFLSNPGWGLPYIRAVLSDWYRSANLNFGYLVSGWFPNAIFSIGGIVSILAIAIVFMESIAASQTPFRRIVWTASLALAATPLIGLALFPSNYVVLILPLVLIVALVWERWTRIRVLTVVLVLLVALLVPFGLYLQTIFVYAPFYTELLSILPPVAAIIGLYWMRWWVLHPPRTWADRIGSHK